MDWVPTDPDQAPEWVPPVWVPTDPTQSQVLRDPYSGPLEPVAEYPPNPTLAYSYVEGVHRGYGNGVRDCIESLRKLADTLEAELADTIRLTA